MRVSFKFLGTAAATLGCAFILQSCADMAPVDTDSPTAVSGYVTSGDASTRLEADGPAFASKSVTLSEESLILNGGFEENGGVGPNGFDDWTVWNQAGGSGNFYVQTGTSSQNGFTVQAPPEGSFAAMSDQGGPGSHIIYQDVTIPNGGATLSFEIYIANRPQVWYHPATLLYNAGQNQQVRIDVMDPTASIDSYTTGVYHNVYTTAAGDPYISGYSTVTFSIDDLDGETVRIRFAQVDNSGNFQLGVDNVCLIQNAIEVDLDVKPGSSTNPINVGSNGTFPVAILGSEDFDVTTVDVASILLGDGSSSGTGVAVKKNGSLHYSIEDVDGDGDMDLMMHFSTQAMVANGDLSSTSTSLSVSGETNDDEVIVGEDIISIVP